VTPPGVKPENGGHNVIVIETNSHRATLMVVFVASPLGE
jgi:hypothetical protein